MLEQTGAEVGSGRAWEGGTYAPHKGRCHKPLLRCVGATLGGCLQGDLVALMGLGKCNAKRVSGGPEVSGSNTGGSCG